VGRRSVPVGQLVNMPCDRRMPGPLCDHFWLHARGLDPLCAGVGVRAAEGRSPRLPRARLVIGAAAIELCGHLQLLGGHSGVIG